MKTLTKWLWQLDCRGREQHEALYVRLASTGWPSLTVLSLFCRPHRFSSRHRRRHQQRFLMSIHDPDIGLEEAIDQHGRARYEAVPESAAVVNDDSTIAPWIDIPVSLLEFGS